MMFSDVIERLRIEAQKTTKTNAELLAEFSQNQRSAFSQDLIGVGGASLAMFSGVVSLAGLLSPTMLAADGLAITAALSTALSSLGTIAVGSALLPVASVVAVGVAAVGVVTMFRNLNPDYGKELAEEHNLQENAAIDEHGHDGKVSLKNWLQGAKNMVVKSIREGFSGENENSIKRDGRLIETQAIVPPHAVAPSPALSIKDQFVEALKCKDTAKCISLLSNDSSFVNQYDTNTGISFLGMAIQHGNIEVIGKLLDAGADMNKPAKYGAVSSLKYANQLKDHHPEVVTLMNERERQFSDSAKNTAEPIISPLLAMGSAGASDFAMPVKKSHYNMP